MNDQIEFHLDDRLLTTANSSHAPDRGDLVNIQNVTYRVVGRTYTVDYSDKPPGYRTVVCIINLKTLSELTPPTP